LPTNRAASAQNLSPIKNALKGHKSPPSPSPSPPESNPVEANARAQPSADNRWQSMFALHYYYWNKWIKYRGSAACSDNGSTHSDAASDPKLPIRGIYVCPCPSPFPSPSLSPSRYSAAVQANCQRFATSQNRHQNRNR